MRSETWSKPFKLLRSRETAAMHNLAAGKGLLLHALPAEALLNYICCCRLHVLPRTINLEFRHLCFSRWALGGNPGLGDPGITPAGVACRLSPNRILPMSPDSCKVAPPTHKWLESGARPIIYTSVHVRPRAGRMGKSVLLPAAGSRRRPAALSQFAVSCCPTGMENARRWPPFCSSLRAPRRLSPEETAPGDRVLWEARSPSFLRPRGIGLLVTCQE